MRISLRIGALVASITASICGSALAAGSMTATPITIDKATAPDVITLPDITVTFDNYLTYSDDVFIVIAGANIDLTTGVPVGAVTCSGPGHGATAFGYVPSSGNKWNFRVASVDGISFGETCTFHGLKIAKASIAEVCQLAATYQAKTGMTGVTIDSGGPVTVANITPPCGPPPPPPPRVIEVGLDIKPGTVPNDINPSSKGSVPVAILSTSSFYAPGDVDLTFPLMFGALGMTANLQRCSTAGQDVDYDGLLDLVCHFGTQAANFQSGDQLGFLVGKAKDGAYVFGWDSVRIVK